MVLSYDPKQVVFIFAGYTAEGYTDGTFITVDRNEDAWMLKMGVDGSGTRAKSNNRSGRIVLTLAQSSVTNDALSALAQADELTKTVVFPIMIRDLSGRTVCSALTGWVVKQATAEFGKEVANRTWTIESDNIQMFVAGNSASPSL
jgi:hypothetical protein